MATPFAQVKVRHMKNKIEHSPTLAVLCLAVPEFGGLGVILVVFCDIYRHDEYQKQRKMAGNLFF